MPVLAEIASARGELTEWRRALHRSPELAFKEHATARFIAEKLRDFGLSPLTGAAGTGVAAVIEGRSPGASVGFRADMDALPINEETRLEYASDTPGVAHACGHDGHTATLLAVARHLRNHPPKCGRVVVIFQPAEELAQGAAAMIADGLLEKLPLDEIYAFHNMPMLRRGSAMVVRGPTLYGARAWNIEVAGVGGHGAAFYKTVDPLQAAARLAVEIPSIVGRYIPPAEIALISVGKLQAGTAPNIIPASAVVGGTLRALSQETQSAVFSRLEQICRGIAALTGCTVDCKTTLDVPPCINAPQQVEAAARACVSVLGETNVLREHEPLAFTDDFAHFLNAVPGAYLFLGQESQMCHHPGFDFDDDLLPVAASIFVQIVADRLGGPCP